jgi:glycosyltransferase involved in cell wall biosynthesis
MGLVGVPGMGASLAARGHEVVLHVAGHPTRGWDGDLCDDIPSALAHQRGAGTFGIIPYPARGTWGFAPAIWRACSRWMATVDIVLLHSLYSFPVLAGYTLARRFGRPFVVCPHGARAPVQRQVSRGRKAIYDWAAVRPMLRTADAVVYSSVQERAAAAHPGAWTATAIVPEGFDAAAFAALPARGAFRSRFLPGHEGPVVLFLSRLNAKKGVDLLIRAFVDVARRRPDARLVIAGGPDPPAFAEQVARWVEEHGVADVTVLAGYVPDRAEALADADVFVLPSVAENFGYAAFEAMASRLPVVVSDTLDMAGEIAGSGGGLAVARTPAAVADAILRLLDDEALRSEMGEKGAVMARLYSWERYAERLERVLVSAVTATPLPSDITCLA